MGRHTAPSWQSHAVGRVRAGRPPAPPAGPTMSRRRSRKLRSATLAFAAAMFGQTIYKPGSVRGFPPWTVIPLGRTLPFASSNQPGRLGRSGPCTFPCAPSLFGLAPGGVCRAASVARRAVRSYRTLSPLPSPEGAGGLLSVALSLGSPPPGVTRHRCCVEPGLSSLHRRSKLWRTATVRWSGRNARLGVSWQLAKCTPNRQSGSDPSGVPICARC